MNLKKECKDKAYSTKEWGTIFQNEQNQYAVSNLGPFQIHEHGKTSDSICCMHPCISLQHYSLHQKKVYTCNQAQYSKCRGTRLIPRNVPGPLESWSNSSQVGFRNFKMRLGPVWTNSMECVSHPLLSIWPPSVLSTRPDKSVYFLSG